jgi:hypothetical protein
VALDNILVFLLLAANCNSIYYFLFIIKLCVIVFNDIYDNDTSDDIRAA